MIRQRILVVARPRCEHGGDRRGPAPEARWRRRAPNASTPTVSGRPFYAYTRGYVVSYDGTATVSLELQPSTFTDSYTPNRGNAVVTLASGAFQVPTLACEG